MFLIQTLTKPELGPARPQLVYITFYYLFRCGACVYDLLCIILHILYAILQLDCKQILHGDSSSKERNKVSSTFCLQFTSSYNIIHYQTTSYNITQHHTTPYNIITTSYNIILHHATSYNIIQHQTTSYNVIQRHSMSCNIMQQESKTYVHTIKK